MTHDFKNFPELTNEQMDFYYWASPHKQILEDFDARVVRVTDGDTVTLRWDQRDFDFPMRFAQTNAPEMSERGGQESKSWLEKMILDKEVKILIDKQKRVDKWGRLLGRVMHGGLDMSEASIRAGHATPFENRREGQIDPIAKQLKEGTF